MGIWNHESTFNSGAGTYLKLQGTRKVLSETWWGQYSKIGHSQGFVPK